MGQLLTGSLLILMSAVPGELEIRQPTTIRTPVSTVGLTAQPDEQATTADSTQLMFEVASIKPDKSGDDRSYASLYPGGRFSITNTSLKGLILSTYRFDITRVLGGSSWIDADRFDIEAKSQEGNNPTQEQLNAMMKTLLADRFQLRVHEESRQLPVYALVKPKTGSVGSRLRRASAADCATPEAPPEKGPRPTANSNGQPWCGRVVFGPAGWSARSVTTEQIAKALEPFVGRIVLNRTNIGGLLDVNLEFNPRFLASPPNDLDGSVRQTDAGVSVFTAVQEQLGLKLETTTSPANVLVIDHAERPTEN